MRKIYTATVVLLPLLSMYFIGIATITLADVVILILIPLLVINLYRHKKTVRWSTILIIVILYVTIQLLLYQIIGMAKNGADLTTLRLILYYSFCAFFIDSYFDYRFGINLLIYVSIASCILWIIQYICLNNFNIFIPGTFPFLKTEVDEYNQIMLTHSWTSYAYSRPRSFFAEPSHFAIYNAMALAILFFGPKKGNNKIVKILIIVSMLLSGSGMAIILLSTICIMNLFFKKKNTNIKIKSIITGLLLILVGAICLPSYLQTDSFQTFVSRTFIEKDSTNGRFGNFIGAFTEEKNSFAVLFGEGIYKISDTKKENYITSIPRIYTYFGIIGFMLFLILSISCFIRLRGINMYSWIILFMICFSSEILFNILVIIYLPFIIKGEKNEE
jgi:membrane protein